MINVSHEQAPFLKDNDIHEIRDTLLSILEQDHLLQLFTMGTARVRSCPLGSLPSMEGHEPHLLL